MYNRELLHKQNVFMQKQSCLICLDNLCHPVVSPYQCKQSETHSFHKHCWPGYDLVPQCPTCRAKPISQDDLSLLSVRVGKKVRELESSKDSDLETIQNLFLEDLQAQVADLPLKQQLEICLSSLENARIYSSSIKRFLWTAYCERKTAELRLLSSQNNPIEDFVKRNRERIQYLQQESEENTYVNNAKYQELDLFLKALLAERKGSSQAFELWGKKYEIVSQSIRDQKDIKAIDFFVRTHQEAIASLIDFQEELPLRIADEPSRRELFNADEFLETHFNLLENLTDFSADEKARLWQNFLEDLTDQQKEALGRCISSSSIYASRIGAIHGAYFEQRNKAGDPDVRNQPVAVIANNSNTKKNLCYSLLFILAAVIASCALKFFSKSQ